MFEIFKFYLKQILAFYFFYIYYSLFLDFN